MGCGMTDTEDKIELPVAEGNPWHVFMTKTLELDEAGKKDRGWHWFWGLYHLRIQLPKLSTFDIKEIQDILPDEHWLKKEHGIPPNYSDDFKALADTFKEGCSNTEFIVSIVFSERNFTTSINFSNFIFPIETYITESVFSDDSDFSNTIFVEDVFFKNTKFSKNADFKNAKFYGKTARFVDATFEKVALFKGAEFKGFANFTRAKFHNYANFENVEVGSYAHFENTAFSSDANFINATFTANAGFKNATFSSHAHFENTTFSANAIFESATFSSDTHFENTTFSADAGFKSATFSSVTNFENTTFSANATFEKAAFSNDVNFSDASFLKNAYFTDAVFSENVDFEKAKFCGKTAKFRNTVFEKIANFTNTTFEGHANFKSSKLKGRTNFQRAEFKFHAPRFYGAEFNNEMTFFGIIPPKFIYAPDEIFDTEDTDETKEEKIILYEQRIQENQNSYENTAILLEEKKKYHDQHLFFRAEMRCRQKIERKRLIRWAFWVYERLANYGYGVDRAIKAWVCHIMLGVGVIMLMVLLSLLWAEWKDWWHFGKSLLCAFPVSFSNANPLAFIGFGDDGLTYCYSKLKSLTPFGFGMIRTVQIIIGIPLLFLLLVTLRVRFRIK